MKQLTKKTQISELGTILGVWAHPDDETMVSGGVMTQAIRNGQKVVCVTFTKGEAGQTADEERWPQTRLGEIRTKELEDSLKIYGIGEHFWFDYHDGQLPNANQEVAIQHLVAIIDKIRPDTILTFAEDGLTGHEDHKTICRWATQAAARSQKPPAVYGVCETVEHYQSIGKKCDEIFDIYWNIEEPVLVAEKDTDICYKLPKDILEVKLRAMKAQPSQYHNFFKTRTRARLVKDFAASESFIHLQ